MLNTGLGCDSGAALVENTDYQSCIQRISDCICTTSSPAEVVFIKEFKIDLAFLSYYVKAFRTRHDTCITLGYGVILGAALDESTDLQAVIQRIHR